MDSSRAGLKIKFTHHHCSSTGPGDDRAVLVCLQRRLPCKAILERLTQIVCEATEQVNEFCIPQGLRDVFIICSYFSDQGNREDIPGAQTLKPANAIIPGTL